MIVYACAWRSSGAGTAVQYSPGDSNNISGCAMSELQFHEDKPLPQFLRKLVVGIDRPEAETPV